MQLTRRTFTAGVATTTTALLAQSAWAQSTPDATPVSTDVEAHLLGVMEELGIPGAVIGIITPDSPEPAIMELGVADLESNEPVSADMNFRIGSVTKPFVATIMLQLVDEGELSLDDTIASILPDLKVVNADSVTVRHLLSMRSGLPQLTDSSEYTDTYLMNPTAPADFGDYSQLMADLPARAEPDTTFDYNNFNFNILGEMIETITGESWDENVRTRISEPLGLTSTSMSSTTEIPAPFARGYGHLDQEVPAELMPSTPVATPTMDAATPAPEASPVAGSEAYDATEFNPTIAGAAGGMMSNVHDQLTWLQALASGELLSEEMHSAQLESIPVDETGQTGYGLGVLEINGMYGHNGAINGYQSVIISSAEFGIHLVVLTNCHPTIGFADGASTIAGELLLS